MSDEKLFICQNAEHCGFRHNCYHAVAHGRIVECDETSNLDGCTRVVPLTPVAPAGPPRDRVLAEFDALVAHARKLLESKQHDYTAGDPSPFANLEACERLGICSTTTGILVRLLDKLMRLHAATNGTGLAVKDESMRDTAADAMNYAFLCWCRATTRE